MNDNLLSVTVDQVMSWKPCLIYSREVVEELFAGRKILTALEILPLSIPAEDRLWAVLREDLVPAAILHEFACRVAERALEREREAGREPDPHSWAAIATKRRWLQGEASYEELASARAAARAAAREAAREAAVASVVASAREAARAAARAAAREAAVASVVASAREAARAAAREAAVASARAAARAAAREAAVASARAAARAAAGGAAREEQCALLAQLIKGK